MAEEKNEIVVQGEITKGDESQDLESRIQTAMRARVAYIKDQSSSLTLEGVRRLLEKDLGLDDHALDAHKRVVKQCLGQLLEGSNSGDDSKNEEDTGEKMNDRKKRVSKDEESDSFEGYQESNDASESINKDKEDLNEDSLSGLLKERKKVKAKAKAESDESEEVIVKKAPTNETITEALKKRAKYLKANSEELTLAGLRRLLEEDLELEKHSLDPFKKFISAQVDELLNPKKVPVPASNMKKNVKKPQGKVDKKVKSQESSDSAKSESNRDEEEVKPKKKKPTKGKESNETKKRKKPAKDKEVSRKRIKTGENEAEESGDENDDEGKSSDDGQSQSSAEKSTKKKAVATPSAYGKRVEHLKSVIKSCGMSVPPNIYKKVKQAPENKRESQLIKELEEILSKEGLSSSPSEKEIKEVKKKKQRAKELEGIDTSNIVSSSRRRSTTSYVPPPKPKISVGSDSDEDSEEDDDDEENDDNDDDDEENGNDDASQSEGSNVDDGMSSD